MNKGVEEVTLKTTREHGGLAFGQVIPILMTSLMQSSTCRKCLMFVMFGT